MVQYIRIGRTSCILIIFLLMIPEGYSSTSEANFLLSDEDCKKAMSGS